ncbi:hypothetical protein BU15DRAFT_72441 [Melanogaster broomeanus]|nr:hypothetical protein BU15DRAFT_72441 [Melanogaster broomeanus]
MSPASKSITPAPSMPGVDWAHLKTPELDSDIEDNDETAMTKAKERSPAQEEKRRCEEEEKRLQEEQEAELRRQEEEQRQHARRRRGRPLRPQKRGRGRRLQPGQVLPAGQECVAFICARASVSCEFTNNGNKRRTTCRLVCGTEGEVRMAGDACAPGLEKARPRPTKSQCRRINIVGESRSGAGPSRVSLDCLVVAIEEMSDRMGELVQAHRESTQVHWESTQAHWESTQASRKARRAFEIFMDEAAICGAPEESSEEESEEEEVAEGELDEEMAGLQEDMAENPMSPPKKLGTEQVRL